MEIVAFLALAFQLIEKETVVGKCHYGRWVSHDGIGVAIVARKGKMEHAGVRGKTKR
jgi:hypothetical protein